MLAWDPGGRGRLGQALHSAPQWSTEGTGTVPLGIPPVIGWSLLLEHQVPNGLGVI